MYPAAGMLVMAIEAILQLTDPSRELEGIRVRETTFHRALIVPPTEKGVEAQFYICPCREESNAPVAWNDFRLCTYQNEEWVENCRGVVGVEYESFENGINCAKERENSFKHHRKTLAARLDSCRNAVNAKDSYEALELRDMKFGPTFQTLQKILHGHKDEATALVKTSDWRTKIPDATVQPHVVHPAALDGVFQVALAALTKGGTITTPPTIATRIQEMWISNKINSQNDDEQLNVCGESRFLGSREVESSIIALDSMTNEPQIVITGFHSTAVTNLSTSQPSQIDLRGLCFNIDWTRPFVA